jgi:hypothetical protein
VCIPGKERYAYGEPFADKAKRLLIPLLALPSLEVVQSLVLLTYQEFATDRDSGLWMYAGMAIRMAQDIGLVMEMAVQTFLILEINLVQKDSQHYRRSKASAKEKLGDEFFGQSIFWIGLLAWASVVDSLCGKLI